MKIAIFSRPGPCFPNVISMGLSGMLEQLGVENKIFYDSIPLLMRLLPFKKQPRRWHNNLSFRIRNKLIHFVRDRNLLRQWRGYDAVIISECYGNAFWKNYFAVEELREHFKGPVISYTESPLDAAPLNRVKEMKGDDYDESRYDFNLFVSDLVEVKAKTGSRQAVIGMNICTPLLVPGKRRRLYAVVDFRQSGYEAFREQQIRVLHKLGIETIVLEGRYPVEEIRKIYREAAIFFLSFPETIGLPIAECLASGTMVATPDSSWPMAWQTNASSPAGLQGGLPECFFVYGNDEDLENKLAAFFRNYDPETTPLALNRLFVRNYPHFYEGDKRALDGILRQISPIKGT